MPKKHFMLDLETMGLQPNAAVVAIGIAYFDRDNIIDTFYTPVSLEDCKNVGLVTLKSTEDWWAKQSPEARSAWDVENPPSVLESLGAMAKWMRSHSAEKDIAPWGNGSDFDLVLMASMCRAVDVETPWKYYNHHCFRTVKNIFRVAEEPRTGVYHHALDDAVTQAKHLQKLLKVYCIDLP